MQVDVSQTADVIMWNRRIFSIMGLWPPKTNDRIFSFFFGYLTIHCCLEYAELIEYIDNLEYVIANLTENTMLTMILVKISAYRLNAKRLHRVLEDIKDDYDEDNYKEPNERLSFLQYNTLAKRFIKISVPIMFLAAIMFYLKPLTGQMRASKSHAENSSVTYVIPYHTRIFFEITELHTYILVYAYQSLIVLIVALGYSGTDCLLVTLMFHLCGQLSILRHQVKNIMTDPMGYHHGIKDFIEKHLRLIRLAKSMDNTFNLLLLQQLVGITVVICLVGYNVIASSVAGEKAYLVTHLAYASSMFIILFGYCFAGECIINESTSLSDAMYNLDWYGISIQDARLLLICMSRAQKPLVLTGGRFYVFSLKSFMDVIKTSMAYLSMLRKLL